MECGKLKAKLADAEKNCAQHMKNIKTWMKEGFNGHCTDAMIIMAERAEGNAFVGIEIAKKDAEIAAMQEIVKAAEAQTLAADKLETAQKAPRKAEWDTADNTTYIQSIDRHKERCRLTEEAVRRKRGE
jgi:hypothetical protein